MIDWREGRYFGRRLGRQVQPQQREQQVRGVVWLSVARHGEPLSRGGWRPHIEHLDARRLGIHGAGAWAVARLWALQQALSNATLRRYGFVIPWDFAEALK